MAKILISPGKYVQGAGELKKLGEYAGVYGKKALVLISAGGQKRSGKLIEESFAAVDFAFRTFLTSPCLLMSGSLSGLNI